MTELSAWHWPRPKLLALTVWRRNVRVWTKLMRVSVVLNFGEPLIYLLGLGYGLGQFIGSMDGMPYLTFLATGLLVASVMNTASFEAMYSVYTRMEPQRTYQAMMATPLRVDDIVAGELLWCASKGLLPSVAILLVSTAMGLISSPTALLVIPVALLTGLAFTGFTIPLAPFAKSYDYFSYFYTLVMVPMFMCSGVFYPLSSLPEIGQWIAQCLPLSHAIALARPLAIGQWPDQVALHIGVLLTYTVLGYSIAVQFYRRRLMD